MVNFKVMRIFTIVTIILYIISTSELFYYYGTFITSIERILPIILLLGGAYLIGRGLSSVLTRSGFSVEAFDLMILIFFSYKIIVDIFLAFTLSDGIFSLVQVVVIGKNPVFYYLLFYDIVWSSVEILYAIFHIRHTIESSPIGKMPIKLKTEAIQNG